MSTVYKPKLLTALGLWMVLLAALPMISSCGGARPTMGTTAAAPKLLTVNITGESAVEVTIGLTEQFTATGIYNDGSTKDVTSEATWSSSDLEVATVAAGGLALALNPGTAEITASWNGMTSKTVELEATGQPMVELTTIRLPHMVPGGFLQLQAQCMSSVGYYYLVKPDSWASSNPGVATVSSNGLVTAVSIGTTDITLSYKGYKSLAYPLTVIADTSVA